MWWCGIVVLAQFSALCAQLREDLVVLPMHLMKWRGMALEEMSQSLVQSGERIG